MAVTAIQASDTGKISFFHASSAPPGYLQAAGAAVSRTTYAALFAVIGTTYGAGDGSTTFNLPDLRGEFVRAMDSGRGVDTGRVLGSAQAGDIASHTHSFQRDSAGGAGGSLSATGSPNGGAAVNTAATGGTETRPRNLAFLACIKY